MDQLSIGNSKYVLEAGHSLSSLLV